MSETGSLRRTALYDEHVKAGGRMVGFGGWEMPVQYSSILAEHKAVRAAAGVFDISHMGEVVVAGSGALAWLNELLTNDVARLGVGQGQYSFMLNERGGVIDDLILYRTGPEEYFLVVNASKIEEDVAWMSGRLVAGVTLDNRSDAESAVAVQGPQAAGLLQRVMPGVPVPARFETTTHGWNRVPVRVARTGYTGEDGVELFFPNAAASAVWGALVSAGAVPCGLGARDSLRLEACYPLNGSDLNPDTTPLEAGLGFAVALGKASFVGRDVLAAQKAAGVPQRLVAIQPEGRSAPPRSHYGLFAGEEAVGEVTSGTHSPTLGHGIGLAYVASAHAAAGTRLEMDVRGQRTPVVVVKKPFYQGSA